MIDPWPESYRQSQLTRTERGRAFARLARGLLWAIVAIAVISILAFAASLLLRHAIYLI